MHNYGRYAFLGSFIIAVMSAVAINYAYTQIRRIKQLKKMAIALPVIILMIYSIISAQSATLFTPRITQEWIEELKWVSDNLEPGKVVSWWDHGSWIQYYTRFPTMVDSVYGQIEGNIQRIARFLVTDNNDTFKDVNATYLILGSDVILYIGAVLGLANETDYTVVFATGKGQMQAQDGVIDVYLTSSGQFELYDEGTLYRDENGMFLVKKRVYVNESGITEIITKEENYTTMGCLIINPHITFYADDKACESNLVKLLFGNGTKEYEFVHANNFVRVYEIT